MNKTAILFIRACKSKNPNLRVNSVYRRFYLASDNTVINTWNICTVLSRICNDFGITIEMLVNDLNPTQRLRFNWEVDVSMEDQLLERLISYIRFVQVDKLDGYIKPAWAKLTL